MSFSGTRFPWFAAMCKLARLDAHASALLSRFEQLDGLKDQTTQTTRRVQSALQELQLAVKSSKTRGNFPLSRLPFQQQTGSSAKPRDYRLSIPSQHAQLSQEYRPNVPPACRGSLPPTSYAPLVDHLSYKSIEEKLDDLERANPGRHRLKIRESNATPLFLEGPAFRPRDCESR